MRQGTIVTVPPKDHPLSVIDAKRQLRIDALDVDEDDFIGQLCASAHRYIERELGYPILRQTRETHLTGFPTKPIWLSGGDNLSVSKIDYFDPTGTQRTLNASDYISDAVSVPACVVPAPSSAWPSTQNRPGAVVVTWEGGWLLPANVPEDMVHAIRLIVGHWYMNREAVVVGTISSEIQFAVEHLLRPHRIAFVA